MTRSGARGKKLTKARGCALVAGAVGVVGWDADGDGVGVGGGE
jgi:hypothetical protein